MPGNWPKIIARRTTKVSPWMEIIEREIQFTPGAPVQSYHAVAQADYVAILAITPGRLIPIVRQYRPAIEAFTWEFPAGLVDPGEEASETCRRELLEETGIPAIKIHSLGVAAPCTGRFSNRIHSFFVEAGERKAQAASEAGVEVKLVTIPALADLILRGEFVSQLHLGTITLAALRGFLPFDSR